MEAKMEKNEFRIGNLLIEPTTGTILKIFEITEEKISVVADLKRINVNKFCFNLKIPLIPEILEKCGAKQNKKDPFIYEIALPSFYNFLSFRIGNNFFSLMQNENEIMLINCEYLHELQNLYFALTKNELEINL